MPRWMPRSWPHPLAAGGVTGSKGRYRLGRAVACVAPDGGGVGGPWTLCGPLRCGEPARGAEAEEWPSERPSGDGGGVLRTSQKEELMKAAAAGCGGAYLRAGRSPKPLSPRRAAVASEACTRWGSPASSISMAPYTPPPHMSKWKRTVPMMPPTAPPVCTPTRAEMSTPLSAATSATTPTISHAMVAARTAASRARTSASSPSPGASTASPASSASSCGPASPGKAPAQATYASPIVLSLCTPCRTARSSKRPKRSDMKTITSSGESFAERAV
mmetsp:Transcript_42988/g.143112  ORF Transcript_42988/g.143112 Transcript_42988/m.143112 type:complete len:274 (+) Transcript_42988:2984-3805(+)